MLAGKNIFAALKGFCYQQAHPILVYVQYNQKITELNTVVNIPNLCSI
jgi:hypothetical protein